MLHNIIRVLIWLACRMYMTLTYSLYVDPGRTAGKSVNVGDLFIVEVICPSLRPLVTIFWFRYVFLLRNCW